MKPYYQDEWTTLYCGDSREVVPSLGKVPLILTDPPYSLGGTTGEWEATAAVAIGLNEAAKRVASKGAMLIFTTSSGRGIRFILGAIGKKLPFNRMLTWHKTGGACCAAGPWRWDTVQIMAFGRSTFGQASASSVFVTEAKYPKDSGHRAELPPGIAEWLYAPFDGDGIVVMDPFCGTGRLLEPAVRAGRKVVGVEIEERYCEVAAKRLEGARS